MAYSQQERERLMVAVNAEMEGGASMREACRRVGLPNSTLMTWLDGDDSGASERYAHARAILLDRRLEEMEAIADNAERDIKKLANGSEVTDTEVIQRAKLRIDQRRWEMSKLMPKRFGERVRNEIAGDPDAPLRTVRELSEAELMAIAAGNGRGDSGA